MSDHSLKANIRQPLLSVGNGAIYVHKSCIFGVKESPRYYSDYSYIEARNKDSSVYIGKNCAFNNSVKIISFNSNIIVGDFCLFGNNVEIINSDFHDLRIGKIKGQKKIVSKDVIVGNNVFIGNNSIILKGVEIGDNCVVASNSIVTKSFAKNTIIGGNPAKFLKNLN